MTTKRKHKLPALLLMLIAAGFMAYPDMSEAQKKNKKNKKKRENFCVSTARSAYKSCRFEGSEELYQAIGVCQNELSRGERKSCIDDARGELEESKEECQDVREARIELCDDFGPNPYNPNIDPANFLTPAATAANPNPFFPLVPGTVRVYQANSETVTVTVTSDTREILGIPCIVVNDVVTENGVVVENTDDYYAQDTTGNVWYMGEVAQNFEGGYLTDLDGSFIAGIDGAKAGILMPASPQVGDKNRQEFLLREAEDIAEVISITGSATTPGATCTNDCVVFEETTPLEPDVLENKYFLSGVGPILAIDLETGEREELISVTTIP